jgi:translation initiation factor 2B subunit (eIF-2B alpha/beta/delta family)/transcriptional regulator with XRE-family HTH domain
MTGKNVELGRFIRRRRDELHVKRSDLAMRIPCDESYLFKIEQKGFVPSHVKLLRVFQELQLDSTLVDRWLESGDAVVESGFREIDVTLLAPTEESGVDKKVDIAFYRAALKAAIRSIRRPAADGEALETYLMDLVPRIIPVWKPDADITYIPEHGPRRNLRMIQVLCKHFKSDLKQLPLHELRILFAVIWIRDLGLAFRKPTPKGGVEEDPLDTYERRSAEYLDGHSHELGLSYEPDKRIATNLCLHHRNKQALEDLEIDGRQKALLALLRIGDLMAVSPEFVKGRDLMTFKPVPHDISADVLRCLFIAKIDRDEQHCMLLAQMVRDGDWGETKLKLLSSKIQQDLQLALDRIKATLVTELRTNVFFSSVQTVAVPPNFDRRQLKRMLDMLGTASSPNAAAVFEGLVESLKRHLAEGNLATTRISHISEELDRFCNLRPCHAQIRNVADQLKHVLGGLDDTASPEPRLKDMLEIVETFVRAQEQAYVTIAARAVETFPKAVRFVVFGYSKSVLSALQALSSEVDHNRSEVYVCECRNKSLYSELGNAVEYSDGVEYATKIREIKWVHVNIVSDISICDCLQEAVDSQSPTYVLLGADGVDPHGNVSGTVGSKTIAVAAKAFHVPVYVLTEGGKVRKDIVCKTLSRRKEWLTTDQRIRAILKNEEIKVLAPQNEMVPVDLIDRFITEKGVLTADQFREAYPVASLSEPSASSAPDNLGMRVRVDVRPNH